MSTAARAPRPRSQSKLVFFLIFGLLTVFVVYMKNARVFDPSSPIAQHFAPARVFLIPHAICGAIALALGAFQFSNRLRARYLALHRAMGYVYVAGVAIAAPLGIMISYKLPPRGLFMGSVVQASGWMLTTGIALYCIRHGNVQQHRRWMIRSYPFAMVFTVARVIIPIPPVMRMGATGVVETVWTLIALAALLPNVFLEWRSITGRKAPA